MRQPTDGLPPRSSLETFKNFCHVLVYPLLLGVGVTLGYKLSEKKHAAEMAAQIRTATLATLAQDVLERARTGGEIICHGPQGDTVFYSSPVGTPFLPREREMFVARALKGECLAPKAAIQESKP